MNTKGVSGVVTAVLLILLVIAAVGILWVVVQNFVQEGSDDLGESTGCLNTEMKVLSATAPTTVTIQRVSGSATITEVNIYVDDTLDTNKYDGDLAVGEIQSETTAANFAAGAEIAVAAVIGGQVCSRSEVEVAI
tara:strand:- start:63 stop:467 length:405 start_codon:yes stop_codon:yes gene_type:complete